MDTSMGDLNPLFGEYEKWKNVTLLLIFLKKKSFLGPYKNFPLNRGKGNLIFSAFAS